jgi:hypothetical protein
MQLKSGSICPGERECYFYSWVSSPLLAPYELILKPDWTSFVDFFYLISLGISIGVIVLSGLPFFSTFAGLSSMLSFDS